MAVESESVGVVWGSCPYPWEICGADATLSNIRFPDDGDVNWSAELRCAKGHRFGIAYAGSDQDG